MQLPLFAAERCHAVLGAGAVLLGGFAAKISATLLAHVGEVQRAAPFRHLVTPGGRRMSVASTNCGSLGWVSGPTGYAYVACDPTTNEPWPPLPVNLLDLAARAAATAGYPNFVPDACLINRYVPGAKMSLHQDLEERDRAAPIVSVSLGLPARFVWGGLTRGAARTRYPLVHGDVVVWGGPSRSIYHGVDVLAAGCHPATGAVRYNLTLRRAG